MRGLIGRMPQDNWWILLLVMGVCSGVGVLVVIVLVALKKS
jgi:hypothetical protein